MGGIDAMALASAVPDPISASSFGLWLLLICMLAACALAIGSAGLSALSPSAGCARRNVSALVVRGTDRERIAAAVAGLNALIRALGGDPQEGHAED